MPMSETLVWARVLRPGVPLVYLDLNHLIGLAQVTTGAKSATVEYTELLKCAERAVQERRVKIVLSGDHLFEVLAIRDPKQRRNIAEIAEALSDFHYFLGRSDIARLELQAGIDAVLRAHVPEPTYLPLIGPSFGWAFGMRGGLRIVDEITGADASVAARRDMGGADYDALVMRMNRELEFAILSGPADDEIALLRANGYAPEAAHEAQRSQLALEVDRSELLARNPALRTGRLRDLVTGWELVHEWLDLINDVNAGRLRSGQVSLEPDDTDAGRRIFAGMPHVQVAVSMKTRYHRNPRHTWTTNDPVDIDALSVAYAYCDVVLTDKAARAALADSSELRRIGTYLPRTPGELSRWLNDQPTPVLADMWLPAGISQATGQSRT